MVDSAAEHDEPDTLAALDPLMLPHAAHDAAGEIAGNLHQRMALSVGGGEYHEVALVVRAGVVAEGGAKFAGRVRDAHDLAADRRAIDMDVERRHEDRNPAMDFVRIAPRKCGLTDMRDLAVGGGDDRVGVTMRSPLGIAEKRADDVSGNDNRE